MMLRSLLLLSAAFSPLAVSQPERSKSTPRGMLLLMLEMRSTSKNARTARIRLQLNMVGFCNRRT